MLDLATVRHLAALKAHRTRLANRLAGPLEASDRFATLAKIDDLDTRIGSVEAPAVRAPRPIAYVAPSPSGALTVAPQPRTFRPASTYPGASPDLADVLERITDLSPADQRKLAAAFKRVATLAKPTGPKLLGSRTYRGYDDFMPDFDAARASAMVAAGVAGDPMSRWYLNPDLALKARFPATWVSCKGSTGRTFHGPRDLAAPRGQFWPGGTLPIGPVYAEIGPIDRDSDVRLMAERRETARVARADERSRSAPEFAMELTPDGEMDTSMLDAA